MPLQQMAGKKKGRNERFIALNKRLGRVISEYDVQLPDKIGLKTVLDYLQNRVQQFLGRHKKSLVASKQAEKGHFAL